MEQTKNEESKPINAYLEKISGRDDAPNHKRKCFLCMKNT